MVVERDPVIAELERYFLEAQGFRVVFARDGIDALQMSRELLPDVIITEILVPRMDGLAVCSQVKRDPTTRHIRVVVFSILHAKDRALRAGADAFILKPLEEDRLLGTVRSLLDDTQDQRTGAV